LHLLDVRHLGFGRGFGEEVVHAGFFGDLLGGQRVVAGDHHGLDAHRAQALEAITHAGFHGVFQIHDAQRSRTLRHDEWRATFIGDAPHLGQ